MDHSFAPGRGRDGREMNAKLYGTLPLVCVILFGIPQICRAQAEPNATIDRQLPDCTDKKIRHCQVVLHIERSDTFGEILVDVRVNGRPAVLIMDTGSNTTILSPQVSGLKTARLMRAAPPKAGTGFVSDARWGEATLSAGAVTWKDRRILVADMKMISVAFRRKIDGILGQDVWGEFDRIEIDMGANRLVLIAE
jgi:hypothetical protein